MRLPASEKTQIIGLVEAIAPIGPQNAGADRHPTCRLDRQPNRLDLQCSDRVDRLVPRGWHAAEIRRALVPSLLNTFLQTLLSQFLKLAHRRSRRLCRAR